MPARTSSQIRTHAQKFFIRLKGAVGQNDAEILKYIRMHPSTFFIKEGGKFAKLSVGDGHQKITDPQKESPSLLNSKKVRADNGADVLPIATLHLQTESMGQPMGNILQSSMAIKVLNQNRKQQPIIPSLSISGGMQNPLTALNSMHLPRGPQLDTAAIHQLLEENKAVNQALSKAYSDLSTFC